MRCIMMRLVFMVNLDDGTVTPGHVDKSDGLFFAWMKTMLANC